MDKEYDLRAFALAYIDTHPRAKIPFRSMEHDEAERARRRRILAGLEELFGLVLEYDAVPSEKLTLFKFFLHTATSYLQPGTPWEPDRYVGPLVSDLRVAGQWPTVKAASDKLESLVEQSRQAHLDILEGLLTAMLDPRAAAKVFTSADLRAIGVGDHPLNLDDYPMD